MSMLEESSEVFTQIFFYWYALDQGIGFSMWLYSLQVASIFIILIRWRRLFVCSGKKNQANKKKKGRKKKILRISDFGLHELMGVEYSQTQRMMNRPWDLNASSRTQEPLLYFGPRMTCQMRKTQDGDIQLSFWQN